MSTSAPSTDEDIRLTPQITATLDRLRRRIRLYVWVQGIALVIAVLAAAFWVALAIDWVWEPTPPVRLLGWIVVGLLAGLTGYRLIARRAFVHFSDSSMALLLERSHRELDQELLTAVQILGADRHQRPQHVHAEMLRRTVEGATSKASGLHLGRVFRKGPISRAMTAAILLTLSIVLFAAMQREAFGVWLERMALSSAPWPRRVQLIVEGFAPDEQGRRTEKIPPDDRFDLIVKADLSGEHEAPDVVEIRYRQVDGRQGRDTMTKVGDARSSPDRVQRFRYSFQDVSADLNFEVVGGDGRVRDLHLRVVPRPRLVDMKLACRYPSYMRRPDQQLDVTGSMSVPEGTSLTLTARATKPLVEVRVLISGQQSAPQKITPTGSNRDQVAVALPPITEDQNVLLLLLDEDGITGKQPTRVTLLAANDEPPAIAVRPHGIGTAVTADARIPFRGTLTDSRYGIDEAWFECELATGEPVRVALAGELNGLQELRIDHAVDLRDVDPETAQRRLPMRPGDQLTVSIRARDFYDLGEQPQVGSSQAFVLDVVTPEKLHALLERRELTLRQRFESIFTRMDDTRNLLARIKLPADALAALAPSSNTGEETENDEPPRSREIERRRLRVAGAIQNIQQAAHESLGVADGFDDVQLQLINNRIDTQDLLDRLGDRIAKPLRHIAEQKMPALQNHLETVQSSIRDPNRAAPQIRQAIDQADAILVAMQQVLGQMMELESYNEVLDLLRSLIDEQQRIRQRTKQQQKERLRRLLD